MSAWYNEIDPFAAQWLRNLVEDGQIASGVVDSRSIVDVQPQDLDGYTQCHFFAGIGGWSLALRLADWPDDQPVWTGSCPCQPLSVAGRQRGHVDERHLWPAFHALIAQRHPATIFGEQVASKDGREWLAGVRTDLEGDGYAVGAADLCAAGVGAPHIRQRLFWVADGNGGRQPQQPQRNGRTFTGIEPSQRHDPVGRGISRGLVDACDPRLQGRELDAARHREGDGAQAHGSVGQSGGPSAFWSDFDIVACLDGKARRIEPGIQPLAHGVPNRVGRLRGYGNAIVPQVAAEFILAWQEALL